MKIRHTTAETTVQDEQGRLIVCQNNRNGTRCYYWHDDDGSNYATAVDDGSYFTLNLSKDSTIEYGAYRQVIRDCYNNVIAEYKSDSNYSVIWKYRYDSAGQGRSEAVRTDDSYERSYESWRDQVDRMTFEVAAYEKPKVPDWAASYNSAIAFSNAVNSRPAREWIRAEADEPEYLPLPIEAAELRRAEALQARMSFANPQEPVIESRLTTETLDRIYNMLNREAARYVVDGAMRIPHRVP